MLKYSWQKIFEAGQGSTIECYRIFKMLTLKETPKNKYDPIYWYSAKNFSGDSFLLHPERLIYDAYKYHRKDICVYVALASQRSLADYKISGILTLDLVQSRLDPRDYLYNKDLIPVKNGILHFPYEEK